MKADFPTWPLQYVQYIRFQKFALPFKLESHVKSVNSCKIMKWYHFRKEIDLPILSLKLLMLTIYQQMLVNLCSQ